MNKFKLFLTAIFAVTVAACSSPGDVKPDEGAEVVDANASSSQQQTAANQDNAESFGLDNQDQFQGSPLEDPNSLLSNTTIYFDFDSSEIRSEFLEIIDAHAQFMVQNGEYQLTIEGHTDDRGSREYNISLGESRADAVKRAFQLQGVSPDRITLISFGEEKPAIEGEGEGVWQQNRRAQLVY